MIKQDILVDFTALEPLSKAPSKKYVKKLIQDCFYLKNYTAKFDESYKTTILQGLGSDIGLDEKQTHKLILELINLLKLCSQKNFKKIDSLFPGGFNEQLKFLLTDLIEDQSRAFQEKFGENIVQSEKLLNLDWRIDIELGNNLAERTQNPLAFVQIDSLKKDTNEVNSIVFQLNKQELNNLYENFNKIKDQIDMLVSE